MEPFKQKADTGRLMASESKRTQLSPDYYGEIAINLKDMANVEVVDGLHIFKLSGWKKRSQAGKTYLSVSVKREGRIRGATADIAGSSVMCTRRRSAAISGSATDASFIAV